MSINTSPHPAGGAVRGFVGAGRGGVHPIVQRQHFHRSFRRHLPSTRPFHTTVAICVSRAGLASHPYPLRLSRRLINQVLAPRRRPPPLGRGLSPAADAVLIEDHRQQAAFSGTSQKVLVMYLGWPPPPFASFARRLIGKAACPVPVSSTMRLGGDRSRTPIRCQARRVRRKLRCGGLGG